MKPTCEMEEEECCNRQECIREEEETGNNNNYSLVAYYLPADREIGHHFKLIALMFLSLFALNIYKFFPRFDNHLHNLISLIPAYSPVCLFLLINPSVSITIPIPSPLYTCSFSHFLSRVHVCNIYMRIL